MEKFFKNKIVAWSIVLVYTILLCVASFGCSSQNTETTTTAITSVITKTESKVNNETIITEETTKEETTVTPTQRNTTTTKTSTAKETDNKNAINLEQFRITVYTPYCDGGVWGYTTSTGVKSTHLKTCAVDPKIIPLGSELNINGLTLKAVDTGSAVKGKKIDIFFDGTKKEAREWISNEFGEYHNVTLIT